MGLEASEHRGLPGTGLARIAAEEKEPEPYASSPKTKSTQIEFARLVDTAATAVGHLLIMPRRNPTPGAVVAPRAVPADLERSLIPDHRREVVNMNRFDRRAPPRSVSA